MDRIEQLRTTAKSLFQQYMADRPMAEDIETQFIEDSQNDHYQLVNVGWINKRRVYGCVRHIDIKGDKVWIQQNGTERAVAEDLVQRGVPKEHIVLGFHSEYKRQFTEYSTS